MGPTRVFVGILNILAEVAKMSVRSVLIVADRYPGIASHRHRSSSPCFPSRWG